LEDVGSADGVEGAADSSVAFSSEAAASSTCDDIANVRGPAQQEQTAVGKFSSAF
jgi:hypothetical protein